MNPNEVKPNGSTTNATSASTPQQHHTQAAEHPELAAKSHKEAAKFIGANDHKSASDQVKMGRDHVVKAQDHVDSAAKKTSALSK